MDSTTQLVSVKEISTIIADSFADLKGVSEVVLFGSCASQLRNELVLPPRDVDVIVIGVPWLDEVYGAVRQAQSKIGLPVNPVFVDQARWVKPKRGLLRRVQRKGNYFTVWRRNA